MREMGRMDQIKESIKAAYKEFKEEPMDDNYNHSIVGIFSRGRVKKILKEAGDLKDKKVLDVGCEAGYVSLKLLEKGAEVYPIDVCIPALEKFKIKLNNLGNDQTEPRYGLVQKIPFGDNKFDVVVCSEVLEHAPMVEKCLEEIYRVLKSKGKFILTFPNEKMRRKIYPLVKKLGINTDVERDVTLYEYTMEEMLKLCKKFKIKKSYAIPWFFPMTNIIVGEK